MTDHDTYRGQIHGIVVALIRSGGCSKEGKPVPMAELAAAAATVVRAVEQQAAALDDEGSDQATACQCRRDR